MRTAKSRGPGAPTLASSLADDDREATEANKPGTPGRSRISRKPLRRECRLFRLPCVACVRKVHFSLHARLAGAACIRHSLRPLHFRGPRTMHHSGMSCREKADSCFSSLRGASCLKPESEKRARRSRCTERLVGEALELEEERIPERHLALGHQHAGRIGLRANPPMRAGDAAPLEFAVRIGRIKRQRRVGDGTAEAKPLAGDRAERGEADALTLR